MSSDVVTGLVGSLGGLIFGYLTGIISVGAEFILEDFALKDSNTFIQGLVTSIILFGAILGSLFGGSLANGLGRTTTCFIASGICLFGAITTVFAPWFWAYLLFRFICGIGVGLVGVVCPLYVTENASEKWKDVFGVLFQLVLTLGILISYVVGYFLSDLKPFIAWRLMLGTGGVLVSLTLLFVSFFFMKEIQKNSSSPINYSDTSELTSKKKSPLKLLSFAKLRQTFTGFVLAVTLQLTGINAIMYYGPSIIGSVGLNNPNLMNIAIGVWNFLATFIAIFLVKRLGRKKLMLIGTTVMSLSLIVTGIFMSSFVSNQLTKGIGFGFGLFFFLAGFEGGPGCLFWSLANEIFDNDIKESGASFVNATQWVFNLLLSTFFPTAIHYLGSYVFFIFGCLGVVCTVLLFFFLENKQQEKHHPLKNKNEM